MTFFSVKIDGCKGQGRWRTNRAARSNATSAALFNDGTIGSLADRQLLERFVERSGEEAELAFSALVKRHGPMVLRVCRSILIDTHDAEDAFQATFLVLGARARSLHVQDSLRPWLDQVCATDRGMHQIGGRTATAARTALHPKCRRA